MSTNSQGKPTPGRGGVWLVGGGPGDPGLLTLRGLEALQKADVVLYDGLVNPILLQHAPATAERICVGKHGQARIWTQTEINQEMVRWAKQGFWVVRLKGGDPAVFARSAEEVEALAAEAIPTEIVPGITAALALGSYAGIPLTHRDHASAVALVTGQQAEGGGELDWDALARFPGTLVLYMGVTTAASWSQHLIRAGKKENTPAAIVRRCSWPDQQVLHTTLGQIAECLTPASKMRPPVLVVVGDVALQSNVSAMLDSGLLENGMQQNQQPHQRPLQGLGVLVTRPLEADDKLQEELQDLGADVYRQPAIEIVPPDSYQELDEQIKHIDRFDWVVFASAAAVDAFMQRLDFLGHDARKLGGVRLAVVGRATAERLEHYRLRCDLMPESFHAEGLGAELAPYANGSRFLLPRADRGRDRLAKLIEAAGGEVVSVVAYLNRDVQQWLPGIHEAIKEGKVQWVTLTSPSIALSMSRLLGDDFSKLSLVAISPLTAEAAQALGGNVKATAAEATVAGIVQAMIRSISK